MIISKRYTQVGLQCLKSHDLPIDSNMTFCTDTKPRFCDTYDWTQIWDILSHPNRGMMKTQVPQWVEKYYVDYIVEVVTSKPKEHASIVQRSQFQH